MTDYETQLRDEFAKIALSEEEKELLEFLSGDQFSFEAMQARKSKQEPTP